MSKILVTGAQGQLGIDMVKTLEERGHDVYGYGRNVLDITRFDDVKQLLLEISPDVVIHAAAFTNVDLAESDSDQAYLVNGIGTRNIAVVSEQIHAKLVYVSTDYVFDGTSDKPYDEFQPTAPLGVYGKSKLAGENFVRDLHSQFFIVRTSWVFGAHGNNFVKTMLKLAAEKNIISVVSDQIGSPTYTQDLSDFIAIMIETEKFGTYHVSNSGSCSWYEFAKEIFRQSGSNINVLPVSSEEFPRPAQRPKNSVLDHKALYLNDFPDLRNWKESLASFLKLYLLKR